MPEGAIPEKDVPTPSSTEVDTKIPDLNDPQQHFSRAEAMKVMAERRREQLREDGVVLDAPADETPPADTPNEPDPEPVAATPADQQVDLQRTPLLIPDDELDRYQVRTKVNGIERVVPLRELQADAQKISAADAYLEKAKATYNDIRATAESLRAGQPPSDTSASTPAPGNTSPEASKAAPVIEALFQGDSERATQLLDSMLTGRDHATPLLDPEQLAGQVERRIALKSALRQSKKDHPAIYADPIAASIADRFLVDELAARNAQTLDQLPADAIGDVIESAAHRTETYFRGKGGPANDKPSTPSRENLRQAKQRIDEPPVTGARVPTAEPPPRTQSDVIAAMAAARNPQRSPPPR